MPHSQPDISSYQSAEYTQRGPDVLKKIIENHFQEFSLKYAEKYETKQGRLRLERIEHFTESFNTHAEITRKALQE